MSNKVYVIQQEDLVALHQIAGTVRVLHDILMSTEGEITITNKALFSMIVGMANGLEGITKHINNGEC